MHRERLSRAHIVALLLVTGCALFLFRLSIFEGWTFVGDSDRLNSVINTRLFEVDALREHRAIPFWSDQQFMGYSIVGLHWMLTTFSPMPYLLALLPQSEMLHALAILSALLLGLTIAATYWMLGAYATSPVARMVGALLFGLGSFTIHKLSQLDLSFAAITAMPILMLLVRLTRRETAARMFLLIAVLWALMIGYTILQEIAYIAMLFGTYALYRTVRLRDPWPVVIAGLAFICGVTLAAPRVLTVATDIPDVARTTVNFQTAPVEILRYFGDGLLGRTADENEAIRGANLNMHEGVQLLTSATGAWTVVMAGMVARSGSARAWGIGLVLVLSTALALWWRPFYDALGRLPVVSREFQVVLMNAVLIGLPLWLLSWWLARRARRQVDCQVEPAALVDETPAATQDAPFFFGFAAFGMAAIILPEVRTVLYYGFMRLDFQHARISMAMTLPLAALVTILLSRFLPSRAGPAAIRWLSIGLAVGLLLWLGREVAAQAVVSQLGEVLEPLRPRRLLTIETVRVATSLVAVLAAMAVLIGPSRPRALACAGGILATWMALEAVTAADFRLSGPQTREQDVPFEALNYMQAPPGRLRIPTLEERAVVRDRLEADQYRVVVQQEPRDFPALIEPHLAAFWDLRLVEGYSTGLPRRLAMLPWQEGVFSPHHLDVNTRAAPPWHLLAALNVKYVISVDQSLWYNPAPGGAVRPLDLARLRVQENPYPVAPRAFFAALVSPAGETPRLAGDSGERPAPADPPIEDPRVHSVAEGLGAERTFSTAGTLDVTFDGDSIRVGVDPGAEDRFLVLNERYYPGWHATVDGRSAEIYATNVLMRGIVVPAGATIVELRYVPFLASGAGMALLVAGLVLTALAWWGVRFAVRADRMRGRATATCGRPPAPAS